MSRRWPAIWLPGLVASLAAATICHGRSITIDEFVSRIRVEESADVVVEESIALRFEGRWNGIHRRIPVVERTRQGFVHRLRLRVESVASADGVPLRHDTSWQGNAVDLKIYVPDAADAVRTVVIRYRLTNAVRFFEDHDELYWNVTGDEWPYAIRAARATISLPGAADNLRVNAFTGAYGSTDRDAAITVDGTAHEADLTVGPSAETGATQAADHEVIVRNTRPLGIRQGLTVAVAWNPGALRRPTPADRWLEWLVDNLTTGGILLVPLAATGMLYARWRRCGRDPRPGPLVVAYEPPAGLGPAEVGTLVDNSPDMRDVMAAIVDLAVPGRIRIREQRNTGASRRAYTFERLDVATGAAPLKGAEKKLMEGLFGRGDDVDTRRTVTTTDLEHSFYSHLPGIKAALLDRLTSKGFYQSRPDRVFKKYVGAGLAVVLLAVVLAPVLGPWLTVACGMPAGTVFASLAAAVLTGLIVMAFGVIMPARTAQGAATVDAIRGFAEFLGRVDAHRLASQPLTPDLFEKYLPYAMALGVESRWARAFAGICTKPPQWYVGTHSGSVFDLDDFSSDMRSMASCAGTAMQSAPRTSDSSGFSGGDGGGGFSGGGFSGGGSGGGGGEGF